MARYNELIYRRLLENVSKNKGKNALICTGTRVTYEELKEQIQEIHRELTAKGSIYNQNICIHTKRSPRMIAAIFAVIMGGGAFFLMDNEVPEIRKQQYLNTVKPAYIISDDTIIYNGREQERIEDVAYIIFTSGSTGLPKGICISFESLYEAITVIPDACGLKEEDRILASSSVAFDPFILETIISLCRGMTVVLANDSEYNNPRQILRCISEYNINIFQAVPSKLKMVISCDQNCEKLTSVERYLLGGEPPSKKEISFLREHTNAYIYNLYGLVEDTIWSSAADITNSDIYDINSVIRGHEIYLLDDNLNETRVNEIGEIYLGGNGLCVDMLNCLNKEERIFYLGDKKLYRTFDLGKRLEGNKIIYIGRNDNQIKINGNRLNPEEVELIVNRLSFIKSSIVKLFKNERGVELLCLFYTGDYKEDASILIKKYLKEYFPQYMIPTCYFWMEEFKYLPSGKINRNAEEFETVYKNRRKE
jgi:non-ribosomal peptide synthetase component F